MAIKKKIGNEEIYKPGVYTTSTVDNTNGLALGANGTILLIGTSAKAEDLEAKEYEDTDKTDNRA